MTTQEAKQAGAAFFHAGGKCVPHFDVECCRRLAADHAGDIKRRLRLYEAWHTGWAVENVRAPIAGDGE